ncbi:calcium-binding protein [Aeromonas hydrophila]|uniref:calcium-binding protein n=1 Tax=Aeromonas hydrophila TaxID=644 RepID=UPI0005364C6D|nr:calcium-binding protein [Aeromonas hydrophila]PNO61690.1 hypothetical protein MC69_006535 [Aeromonas hydrophila]
MEFADGSKLVGSQLFEIAMVGTVNADTLNGSGFNEIIYGGAADDVVSSEGGNDTVYGEEGNDTLHGGDGNDQLFGGAGNDTLTVNGNGSNTLDGGEGDDKLTINRSTDYNYQRDIARNMKNTLRGGTGNDRLEGSVSADTYLFNRGDGQDVINDFDQNAWSRTDRIVLGEGITLSDLNIRRIDNHLVLLIGDAAAGDSITIENAYTDARFRIEELEFADGSKLVGSQLFEIAMVGTVNADTLNGSGFNEIIYGGAADDVVSSEGGNDTVYGEEGNDTLHGGDGNDQLFGGAGNDTLTVNGNGSNTLDGGEGDDKLTINRSTDYNYQRDIARNMKNTLRGGTGNDRLEGSVSADTYLFNRGDGQDVINDFDQNAWSRTDRIVLGEGITLSDLNIRRIDNHLVLLIGDAAAGTRSR